MVTPEHPSPAIFLLLVLSRLLLFLLGGKEGPATIEFDGAALCKCVITRIRVG